jgi:hypothetical protein
VTDTHYFIHGALNLIPVTGDFASREEAVLAAYEQHGSDIDEGTLMNTDEAKAFIASSIHNMRETLIDKPYPGHQLSEMVDELTVSSNDILTLSVDLQSLSVDHNLSTEEAKSVIKLMKGNENKITDAIVTESISLFRDSITTASVMIVVEQKTDITANEDIDVQGTYGIFFNEKVPLDRAADVALEIFFNNISITTLDDFETHIIDQEGNTLVPSNKLINNLVEGYVIKAKPGELPSPDNDDTDEDESEGLSPR